MNEDCTLISCPVPKNPVQDFANQYTLDAVVVGNEALVEFVSGVLVTIPAGTINVPVVGFPSSLTVQGCNGPITLPVPLGSTVAQTRQIAQNLANMAAQAQAQCNSEPPGGGGGSGSFTNNQLSVNSPCTVSAPLLISAGLPAGITQSNNSLVIKQGMFSSQISQSDADNQAINFLTNFLNNLFLSGEASCNSGCVDNDILTKTNNTFVAPGNGSNVNMPVVNSGLFVADSATGYWLAQPVWDATPMAFVVNSIIDANTINITQLASGFFSEITGGTIVSSGSLIYLSAYHGYVTTPPSVLTVGIQNFAAQFLAALNSGCARCPGSTTLWDGTFPNLDLAFGGFNEFGYEEGSSFGFTDKEILGNVVNAMFINTLYVYVAGFTGPWNLGYWALTIQCPGQPVLNAAKFGGRDATGVYYLVPGECLYPVFGPIRCFVVA